jgi:glycosyltransferase involved in cell wall biosynthesis
MNRASVLLPSYNEADNLAEVIVVDDGSTDDTRRVLAKVAEAFPDVRSVHLRRNFGKSLALQAGFHEARGDVIILMDADGQDDPHEIPKLLEALDGGLHLVTGRRVTRRDRFIKRVTSRLFNAVTAKATGVPGRDFNSGLKAMRRDVVDSLNLYGELHRYIPVIAHWAGFRVGEAEVVHRPRLHGTTKFGGARFWRGFLDLLTVQFITRFTARPLHLFGGLGMLLGFVGTGLLAWMTVIKIMGHGVSDRPALLAGILLVIVAVQLFSIGLLAEFIAHSRGKIDASQLVDKS